MGAYDRPPWGLWGAVQIEICTIVIARWCRRQSRRLALRGGITSVILWAGLLVACGLGKGRHIEKRLGMWTNVLWALVRGSVSVEGV